MIELLSGVREDAVVTSLHPTPAPPEAPLKPAQRGARRRVVVIVSALVAVVLIVAVVVFMRWRDGLHLFRSVGNEIGADQLPIGRTLYVGDTADPPNGGRLELRITAIRPVVTSNTAHATIRVIMCKAPQEGGEGLGSAYSLKSVCVSAAPFTPATYAVADGSAADTTSVIIAITPHSSGHVHVAGVHITYERGLRRGDQRTGIEIDTRTPTN